MSQTSVAGIDAELLEAHRALDAARRALARLERQRPDNDTWSSPYQSELAVARRTLENAGVHLRAARFRALHARLERLRRPRSPPTPPPAPQELFKDVAPAGLKSAPRLR